MLSVGHASMLLYALLHLANVISVAEHEDKGPFAVTLDDIRQFRQFSSVTPGHPEYRLTSGVETTTGPLAQRVFNSVGMAMAQKPEPRLTLTYPSLNSSPRGGLHR